MPLNPEIPLMVGKGVPEVKGYGALMKDVMDIRQSEAQIDAWAAQAEDRKAMAEDRRAQAEIRVRQAEKLAGMEQLFKEHGNDPTTFIEQGWRRGYDMTPYVKAHREERASAITAEENELKNLRTTYSFITDAAARYQAETDPTIKDSIYQNMMYMVDRIDRESAKAAPQRAGPDADQYVQTVLSTTQTLDEKLKRQGAWIQRTKDTTLALKDLDEAYGDSDSQEEVTSFLKNMREVRGVPADVLARYPAVWSSEEQARAKQRALGASTRSPIAVDYMGAKGEKRRKWVTPEQALTEDVETPATGAVSNAQAVIITEPPTAETRTKMVPGLPMTEGAIWTGGLEWALTGKLPSLGMGAGGGAMQTRGSIVNTGSEMAARSGLDVGTLRAAYRANATTLNKMIPFHNQSMAYAESAKQQLQLAQKAGEKVYRSDIPIVNRMRNWISGTLQSNEALTPYETYIFSAAREYAKVASGAGASVAQLTDTAAKRADELMNSSQSPAAFDAAAEAMGSDLDTMIVKQRDQIGGVSKVIGDFLHNTYSTEPETGEDYAKRVVPLSSSEKATSPYKFFGTYPGGEQGFETQAQLDAFIAQAKAKGVAVVPKGESSAKTEVSSGVAPPANPKVGDTWMSPTGLVTFQGKGKGWQ